MQLSTVPPYKVSASDIPQDVPVYRLEEPFFDDMDEYIDAGRIIEWEGTPNTCMFPMNQLADAAFREFLAVIDAEGERAANYEIGKDGELTRKKKTTKYQSLLKEYEAKMAQAEESRSNRKRTRVLGRKTNEMETPILGARKAGRPRTKQINVSDSDDATLN